MRIGIDAHILGKGKGGVERVVDQMVRRLPTLLNEHKFTVFINSRYQPVYLYPNVSYMRIRFSDPIVQRSLILPWIAHREKLDLLHVQRIAPPHIKSRLIVHTHDLLPITAPADHRGWRDQIVRSLTPGSLRRADVILTVSRSVATEIRHTYPFAANRTAAIANGVELDLFRPLQSAQSRTAVHRRLDLSTKYILYLGAIMARKNLRVAIEGFLRFRDQTPEASSVKLVIAGMCRSASYEYDLRRLAATGPKDAVCFAGFLPDSECVELLQHASAFLAPSRGEGFDLPALEAMACQIPVVCSDIPVHRELLGDNVLYFKTDSPESLALGIRKLMCNETARTQLAENGSRLAQRYTWHESMRHLAGLYETLLSSDSTHLS